MLLYHLNTIKSTTILIANRVWVSITFHDTTMGQKDRHITIVPSINFLRLWPVTTIHMNCGTTIYNACRHQIKTCNTKHADIQLLVNEVFFIQGLWTWNQKLHCSKRKELRLGVGRREGGCSSPSPISRKRPHPLYI